MERLAFEAQARANSWELAIHLARYGIVAELCRGRRVLDIACGEGFGSHLMASKWGALSVEAVDVSDEALESAKKHFPSDRITWRKLNADAISTADFSGQFDLIISLETIEHLDNPRRFLEVLKSLLAPGGVLCVSCPNDEWFYGKGVTHNPYHKHVLGFEEFKALAEDVLGKASAYMLGAPTKGICNVPLDWQTPPLLSTREAMTVSATAQGICFPPARDEAPTNDASLYFVGLWGLSGAAVDGFAPVPSGAWTAVSPDLSLKLGHTRPPAVANGAKPLVILVADVPGWAYCNIAHNVQRFLGVSYDIQIVYVSHYDDWAALFYDVFWLKRPVLVHVFWREFLFEALKSDIASGVSERFKIDRTAFLNRFASVALTTSVYDHLNLDQKSAAARQTLFWLVDAYFVSSNKLFDIYSNQFTAAPDLVIEDAIDPELFKPSRLDRFEQADRELVIGWAGNSNWCRDSNYDPKGFHTVLIPALEILEKEGMKLRGHFADASVNKIPRAEMCDYYNSIDIYVCVSEIEGTPNPVLESMACGVPVVSTDVGIVPQVFGPLQSDFILKERTPRALADLLAKLVRNRTLLQKLSEENLTQMKDWTWQHKMSRWLSLFSLAISRTDSRSINRKKWMYERTPFGATAQGHSNSPLLPDLYREVDRLLVHVGRNERLIKEQADTIQLLRARLEQHESRTVSTVNDVSRR